MRLTIEHENIKATIETEAETISEIFESAIKPALLAVGFQSESIDEYFEPNE